MGINSAMRDSQVSNCFVSTKHYFEEFGREICSGDIFHLVNDKMHFVGRKDGQLKLRGRRIELNEVGVEEKMH